MLRLFVSGKFIYFKLFVVFAVSTYGIEVKNAVSSTELLNRNNKTHLDLVEYCSKANLRILPNTNFQKDTIDLFFELSNEAFNHCFSFFDIFLRKDGEEVAAVKIPVNYAVQKAANHTFENIPCGLYELKIKPCFNDQQCSRITVRYPKLINMSSIQCNGIPPSSLFQPKSYGEDFQLKIIAIMTVIAILLMLSIGAFAYCHYHSIVIRNGERENKKLVEKAVEVEKQENNFKRIEVYILYYSNEVIMRNVEILKDFLLKLPNVSVVLIKDELHKILLNRTWWVNNVLQKSDGKDHTLKKVIIVDADENKIGKCVDDFENENENQTFNEVITKLNQDWLSSLNDYDRIFVIRFNGLPVSRSKALDFVVPGVRYDIPDNQLVTLCKVLLSGSDSCYKKEDLKELINCHPITNLSPIETEYYHV